MRIMQCWDDGDVDDIRLVEILKKHGARATFNINPGGWKSKRREAHRFKGTYQVHKLALDEMPLSDNYTSLVTTIRLPR